MCPVVLLLALRVGAPEAAPEDFYKAGIVDLDNDCPTAPGTTQGKSCPGAIKEPVHTEPPPKIEVTKDRIVVGETVQFRSGSASVDPASFALLRAIAEQIKALPADKKLVIDGHTDDRGNKKKNEKLSEDRA